MREKRKTLDKTIDNLKLKKIAKKQKLQERGITLIALVVTIIILLILAGVTLNIALSENGLFSKAKKAADDYNEKSIEEKLELLYAEKAFDDYNNNTNIKSDVTSLLEEMAEGEITQEDIDKFNEYLETYDEEIKSISFAEDLTKIGTNDEYPIDGLYVQLQDIDMITEQIGTIDNPFKGVYNGNGKSIKKLELTSEEDYTGMFRENEGTIKNVTIDNCNISSTRKNIGAITGSNKGKIENCSISSGEIKCEEFRITNDTDNSINIGAICGYCNGGSIRKLL